MKLRISDDPLQWRRFMMQFCTLCLLLASWLAWREIISAAAWLIMLPVVLALALVAWMRPGGFGGFYRFGMKASAWVGGWMGAFILLLLFLLVMTPLGWVLRLCGYDPLALRKTPTIQGFWRPAQQPGRMDRLF